MGAYRHVGGLALVGLLALTAQLSVAAPPTQYKPSFIAQYPGCPMYQVGDGKPTHAVTLEDRVSFIVKPTHSILLMDIADNEQLYQATVDGSRITLSKCEADYTDCVVMKEEASKSSDLLNVNQWNYINVSLVENQIFVSVNMKQNVMGDAIFMETSDDDQQLSSNVKVSILDANDQTRETLPSGYAVDVNVLCNDTYTPIVEVLPELPSVTTEDSTVVHPAPFPTCHLYEVGHQYPQQSMKLENKLTLAIFPNRPLMCMHILIDEELYKATIEDTMIELLKCNKDATDCQMISEGGAKDSSHFKPNAWNYVTVLLKDNEITLQVNEKANIMGKAMAVQSDADYAEVTIIAVDSISSQTVNTTDYSATINIACNETHKPTPVIRAETTVNPLNTPDAVVETSTAQPESTGSNSTLIIIVVIMVLLLCLVVGALVVSHVKKSRSANINQHSPLNEQQQQ